MIQSCQIFSMQAGEIVSLHLQQGSRLYLLQGHARLLLPVQWQAESMLFSHLELQAETHVSVQGMVQLHALCPVRGMLLTPERPSLVARVVALFRGIRLRAAT